ncbi:MAG: 2-C-methyl-D-erythritol 4-phosphate cytidylyltransferase [Candidatus Marinimicrobia bacterium]|nr:2-C-methyl-D-erythritol 4-phosphate cytidylyltransferase [Candidatus Neomarinimicrobiota bacterium]
MNSSVPKQFLTLGGKTVLYHTLQKFLKTPAISEIIIVVAPEMTDSELLKISLPLFSSKSIHIVVGGKRRQDSVYNGLIALNPGSAIVSIHDAVRPFIRPETISTAIDLCSQYDGVIVAAPTTNTLKEVCDHLIVKTVSRELIWQAQTPQTFRLEILLKAYEQAYHDGVTVTDDAALVERIGGRIRVIEGDAWNIKITSRQDLILAQSIFEKGLV